MHDTPDEGRLARIEDKLDRLLAIWAKFEPVVSKMIDNPATRWRARSGRN